MLTMAGCDIFCREDNTLRLGGVHNPDPDVYQILAVDGIVKSVHDGYACIYAHFHSQSIDHHKCTCNDIKLHTPDMYTDHD